MIITRPYSCWVKITQHKQAIMFDSIQPDMCHIFYIIFFKTFNFFLYDVFFLDVVIHDTLGVEQLCIGSVLSKEDLHR